MKFKYIILVFNILLVFFLSLTALLPVALFGDSMLAVFFRATWPLILVLCLAFVGMNVFFLLNYRLFSLLEREDWPALTNYLEQKVFNGRYFSARQARLLATSYLVMGDFSGVLRLENKVAISRPALLEANVLVFGVARILSGDIQGAANFFQMRTHLRTQMRTQQAAAKNAEWLRWYYGFSLLLARSFDLAEAEFKVLAPSAANVLVAGLSAFFLSRALPKYSLNPAECRNCAAAGREQVVKTLKNVENWQREAAQVETEAHIAIIKQYIKEAGNWLFGAQGNA